MIEKASLDFYREHLEGDFLKIYRPYLRGIKPEADYQRETRELIQNFARDLIQARKMRDQWQMRYMQLGEVMYRPAEEEEIRDILAMADALYAPVEVLEQMPDDIEKPESALAETAAGVVESLFITDHDNFFGSRQDSCENTESEKQAGMFQALLENGVEIQLKVIGEPTKKAPVWGFGGYTEYSCEGYVTGYMKAESRPVTVQCYEDSREFCLMWQPKKQDSQVRDAFWKEYSDWNRLHAEKLESGFREKISLLQKAVDARTFVKRVHTDGSL